MTILANIALAGEHIFQVLAQYLWVLSQYLRVLSRWIQPKSLWQLFWGWNSQSYADHGVKMHIFWSITSWWIKNTQTQTSWVTTTIVRRNATKNLEYLGTFRWQFWVWDTSKMLKIITGWPRLFLCISNGYKSETVYFWPQVGKAKMYLTTIQFFKFFLRKQLKM